MRPPPFTFKANQYHPVMELPQLEDRILEIGDIEATIGGTLDASKRELLEAQAEIRSIRVLNEIEKFIRGLNDEVAKAVTQEEKLVIVASGLGKLAEYVKAEPIRLRDRVIAITERVAVLESTSGFLRDRKGTYAGRVAAINRIVEGEGDPRHPEKISTVREAERIKKQRKSDT